MGRDSPLLPFGSFSGSEIRRTDSNSISFCFLLYLYANPFTSVKWLCGSPPTGHKDEREKWAKCLFILIGILRLLNTVLWILLIKFYFEQINGKFNEIHCDNGMSYCSKDYLLDDSCIVTNKMCEISHSYVTLPVIVFLSFSQIMVFFIKDRGANGSTVTNDPSHDGVESPISLTFSYLGPLTMFYLFLLFALEAVTLPFGTKHGVIAFVLMETHSLEYTVIIFLSVLGVGVLMTVFQCAQGEEMEDGCGWRVVTFIFFACPYILALLALIVHSAVVLIWNLVDNYQFYSSHIFFISLHGTFLWYKSLRTFFSIFSLLEAALTWICLRIDQGERVWWEWSEGHGEFQRSRVSDPDPSGLCLCATWLDWPSLIPTPDADQIE